ncbi:UNVERIFIED_CONTAM: hypothetical protein Slati_1356100 [Sesamum latifolium]|uniref:Uncharacterized protein n=1 Tax=Sesamum latifolium TaxID=2727402 RepID=A0AAW2XPP4_9LAMI
MNKGKDVKNPSPGWPIKEMPRSLMMGNAEVNDPPRKGVIRMIVGGPTGGDSQKARKTQVREPYGATVRKVMDVEPANDALSFNSIRRNEADLEHRATTPWSS